MLATVAVVWIRAQGLVVQLGDQGVGVGLGLGAAALFAAVQVEFGVVAASLFFGLAHVGGRDSLVFGSWVVVMGFGLVGLVHLDGGCLAPIVAHIVYDAAAIAYIHWDATTRRESPV